MQCVMQSLSQLLSFIWALKGSICRSITLAGSSIGPASMTFSGRSGSLSSASQYGHLMVRPGPRQLDN